MNHWGDSSRYFASADFGRACGKVLRMEQRRAYRARVTLSRERAQVLAERLRAARTAAGLTQVVLAERAGLTAEHIQTLERGVGSPTLASVYALADALKRPIGDLLP